MSLGNGLSHGYQYLAQVAVSGLPAVRMIDINHISVPAAPSGSCNCSSAGSIHGSARRRCPVNSLMIGTCTSGRSAPAAEAGGKTSACDRLNVGRRYLGSSFHDLWNRFIGYLLFYDVFGYFLVVFKGNHCNYFPVPRRRLLQRFSFRGIPIVIIYIDYFLFIILFIIHFFLAHHCQLRLRHRNDQFFPCPDHGIFILKGRIHFYKPVHRNVGLNGNLRKSIAGNHLIHVALFFILCHFPDRRIQIRKLVFL